MLKRNYGRVPKLPNQNGEYRCSKCQEWKLPTDFNKNNQQTTGLNYMCRSCANIDVRKHNLPAKYGISVGKFSEMLLAQGGKCACCQHQFNFTGRKSERPCVDHNHATKEVRGLLCGRCNLAAGNVQDSSIKAEQLAVYLKSWKC